jgi:hypothetical protein
MLRVAQHPWYGKVLLLDDDVMGSELDDGYDAAIASLVPADAHRILIAGGGDNSLAARLRMLPSSPRVTICELDPEVTEACHRYFPVELDGQVSTWHGDAFDFVRDYGADYDVIIDDMTCDPQNGDDGYRVRLGRSQPGKWVISQSGGCGSEVDVKLQEVLQRMGAERERIARPVLTFQEVWTFTKYRL